MKKKRHFVPVARPGTKGHPLLSWTGVPGWETGTTAVSQPGQINVFVVVSTRMAASLYKVRRVHTTQTSILKQYMLVFERTQYMLVSPVEFWYFLFVE